MKWINDVKKKNNEVRKKKKKRKLKKYKNVSMMEENKKKVKWYIKMMKNERSEYVRKDLKEIWMKNGVEKYSVELRWIKEEK